MDYPEDHHSENISSYDPSPHLNECHFDPTNDDAYIHLDSRYLICGPIVSLLTLIGVLSNSLFLFVLFKTRPIPVVNYYIIPLCLCDLCVLCGSFFMSSLPYLLYGRMETQGAYVPFYPFLTYFSNFAYTCCVWLIVSLSVERYFALRFPLAHRIHNAKRRSVKISGLCLVLAVVYNLPRYFELVWYPCIDSSVGRWVPILDEAEFRHNRLYWIAYKIIMGKLVLSLGPLLVLCVLSILMWRLVEKSKRFSEQSVLRQSGGCHSPPTVSMVHEHETMVVVDECCSSSPNHRVLHSHHQMHHSGSNNNGSRDEHHNHQHHRQQQQQKKQHKHTNNLTFTLFCIVLKFLICHTLPTIIDLCETLMDPETFHKSPMDNLVDTSTLLIVTNSTLNFWIHVWSSRQFRRKVKSILMISRNKENGDGMKKALRGTMTTSAGHTSYTGGRSAGPS